MDDFIDTRLRDTMQTHFSTTLEIHHVPQDTAAPHILRDAEHLSGCPYTGMSQSGVVTLKNFIHPISNTPVQLSISYTEDVWSGQMDHWEVAVSGLTKEDIDALMQVFDPSTYSGFSCSNHIRAYINVDGVTSNLKFAPSR